MVGMFGVFLMGGMAPAKTTSESMPEPIQKLPVLGSIQWQNQPLPFVPAGPRAGISGSGMVVHGGLMKDASGNATANFAGTHHWTTIEEVTHTDPPEKVLEIVIDDPASGWAAYRVEHVPSLYHRRAD